jgi:nicotinate-nucleotide adenylyltransferase
LIDGAIVSADFSETEKRERIGVFGGTFDPIHLGHLIIAAEIQRLARLDRVLFVPAGRPPHKLDQHLSNDHVRLKMLNLAIEGVPGFSTSTVDLDRHGPSFTVDTLRILHRQHPDTALVFVMGEDSLRDFLTWHDPAGIIEQAELAVARRPGVQHDLGAISAAIPGAAGRIHVYPVPEIGIASRDLRERAVRGDSLRFFVPDSVAEFIREHGFYLSKGPV